MPGPTPAKGIPISRGHPQPHTQPRSPWEPGPVLLISMPTSIPRAWPGHTGTMSPAWRCQMWLSVPHGSSLLGFISYGQGPGELKSEGE